MHQSQLALIYTCSLLLLTAISPGCAAPTASGEMVLVEEVLRLSAADPQEGNSSTTLITLSDASSEELPPTNDDLIILTHRDPNAEPVEKQQHQFDNSHDLDDDSLAKSQEENYQPLPPLAAAANAPIDMSAFAALIPVQKVNGIISNYYRHDTEVQRAFAFLNSSYFAEMKLQLLQLPEMLAITGYLNSSGLNVIQLLQSIMQATRSSLLSAQDSGATTLFGNEIVNATPASGAGTQESSHKGQLNGLHGLVDSILGVLPQDRMLAAFFDKMETDEQFAHLVNSIGTPKFAKILSNLQNSEPLRNFIFVLHNNGIYIARIVDSLKSYFFLASF